MSPDLASSSTQQGKFGSRTAFGSVGQRQGLLPGLVTKVLEPFVGYVATPQTSNWQMGNGPQEFKLIWDGNPGSAHSLKSLAQNFHLTAKKNWGKLEYDKEKWQNLLKSLSRLVELAVHLHQKGWSLGYCHPENILIKENGEVFLADLGFVFVGASGGELSPAWMSAKTEQAFYWDGDAPEVRLSRPGASSDGFIAADTRLLGRIIKAALTGKFTAPLSKESAGGELAKYWGIACQAEKGDAGIEDLLGFIQNGTVAVPQPKPVEPPGGGYSRSLVGLLAVCVIVIGMYGLITYLNNPVPNGGSEPTTVVKPSPIIPVVDKPDPELERLYREAMDAGKENRLGKFTALVGYSKDSSDKLKKAVEVRKKIGDEILKDFEELDIQVQEDPLLEYPTAGKMETTTLSQLGELEKAAGKYGDEAVLQQEKSCREFAQRRIQELRRE
ncbi:MAG: hypothetical protein EXR99_16975 [Gemmataceae bacterium]|nr:hypothetical protein [Gemmataceae bacterium]